MTNKTTGPHFGTIFDPWEGEFHCEKLLDCETTELRLHQASFACRAFRNSVTEEVETLCACDTQRVYVGDICHVPTSFTILSSSFRVLMFLVIGTVGLYISARGLKATKQARQSGKVRETWQMSTILGCMGGYFALCIALGIMEILISSNPASFIVQVNFILGFPILGVFTLFLECITLLSANSICEVAIGYRIQSLDAPALSVFLVFSVVSLSTVTFALILLREISTSGVFGIPLAGVVIWYHLFHVFRCSAALRSKKKMRRRETRFLAHLYRFSGSMIFIRIAECAVVSVYVLARFRAHDIYIQSTETLVSPIMLILSQVMFLTKGLTISNFAVRSNPFTISTLPFYRPPPRMSSIEKRRRRHRKSQEHSREQTESNSRQASRQGMSMSQDFVTTASISGSSTHSALTRVRTHSIPNVGVPQSQSQEGSQMNSSFEDQTGEKKHHPSSNHNDVLVST